MAEVEEPRALADNRRARFDYDISRRVEAGVVLRGTEIKSVRAGRVDIKDGYARVDGGQAWLRNVHIAPWPNAEEHDPTRPRKLLLHRDEIGQLAGEVTQKGHTIVPLRVYLKNGVAKVELGVARGKKKYDKRRSIREREVAREIQTELGTRRRGV